MISGNLYISIYLIIVTIFTFIVYTRYKGYNSSRISRIDERARFEPSSFIFLVFMISFVGLRPESYKFVDMLNYRDVYYFYEGSHFSFNLNTENLVFDNLFSFWYCHRLGFSNFILLMCALNFGITYIACHRFFPNDTMAAFLVFLGAFSTFSYATNGIKAGAASAIFLLALSYYKKWPYFISLLLLSYGMHHSMSLPIGACLVAFFIRNTRFYFLFWIICVLIASLRISFFQGIFADIVAETFADAHGASYLQIDDSFWGINKRFRIDFIMYSAVPMIIGYFAVIKNKLNTSNKYVYLLNVYVLANSIWMLCMYASFTNRIAYLSWLMYPIVLIYPFLREQWSERQYNTFSIIMLAHLAFTLFMHLIYYA